MQSHAIHVIDDVIATMCKNITHTINTSSVMIRGNDYDGYEDENDMI